MASQKTWDPSRGDYYRIVVGPNGVRRKAYDRPTPQEAISTQQALARPDPEPQGPPPIRDGFHARGGNPVFTASHLRGGTSNPNPVFSTPRTLDSARQNQVSYGRPPQGQASQGQASQGQVPPGQAYRQNLSGGTMYPFRAQGQGSGSYQLPSQRQETQTYRSQLDLIDSTEQLSLSPFSTTATTPTLTTSPRTDVNRSRRLSSTTAGSLTNQLPDDHRMASNPRQFFKKGRVFSYNHIEQASQMALSTRSSQSSNLYFLPIGFSGNWVYSSFRRFIIVKVDLQVNQSLAVPIATYGGRGALKPSIDPRAHAIAYSGARPPPLLPGEQISKDPIKVLLASPTDKFDPKSRINFRKVVHIDHGWQVKNLGMVDDTSLPKLNSYYRQYADV